MDVKSLTITAFAIAIAGGIAYWWYQSTGALEERFWDIPARAWKVERVFETPSKDGCSTDFFQTPHFQGILSPRFSNVNYGPNLRTQLPGYYTTGVPADPLGGAVGGSFGAARSGCVRGAGCGPRAGAGARGMLMDVGYGGGGGGGGGGGTMMMNEYERGGGYGDGLLRVNEASRVLLDPHNPSSYANGNYKQVLAAGIASDYTSDESMMNGAMGSYLTADGNMKQPIIYDRFMYANRKSRLRNLGDPIRGDLPIVPLSGNWFTPSVHPNLDLQAGALNVLGGVNNETNHQLANLIYNSSGGGDTTIGGVNMARMNAANQVFGATAAARGDVIMTSFP
jgi:Family of unknown function (DUF5850)